MDLDLEHADKLIKDSFVAYLMITDSKNFFVSLVLLFVRLYKFKDFRQN